MKINKNEIYQILSTILGIEEDEIKGINVNDDLIMYGLASIESMQLIIMLEEQYSINFKDEDLLTIKYNTLNKLFSLLEQY